MTNAVSIHAPVKGATMTMITGEKYYLGVSIHAPVKGATPSRKFAPKESKARFNPRTREGCDLKS